MPGLVSKAAIDDVRRLNDVVEVIGSYIQLKRAGATFRALCPFHKEKTPSFHVNPQRQIFHCFGCGAGGDVFRFLMLYDGVDFPTALKMLAQRVGVHLAVEEEKTRDGVSKDEVFKLLDEVAGMYHQALLAAPDAAPARAYLQSRELGKEIIEGFRIGYSPEGWDFLAARAGKKNFRRELLEAAGLVVKKENSSSFYDRFRGRVMFPIRDELSRVIGFSARSLKPDEKMGKYVNSPETMVFRKSRVLYALDRARRPILDQRQVILCEGQIDCIRCHAGGFHNVVASQGTALTEEHARLLKRYADSVLLVLDADKAGQDAAVRGADVLVQEGLAVSLAALPPGEDPDSLIRKKGPPAFAAVLAAAQSVVLFQIGVLKQRENLASQEGLLRVSRAALETISRASSDILRDRMLHEAATALHVREDALRQDLRKMAQRTREPAAPAKAAEPARKVVRPAEEIALAELLSAHRELAEMLERCLPLDYLTDSACRKIVHLLLQQGPADDRDLIGQLAGESEECQQLAARILMAPEKLQGDDITPDMAAQDLVLVLWRRALERRREEWRAKLPALQGKPLEQAHLEITQLTLDIALLRQGWDKARHLLEM